MKDLSIIVVNWNSANYLRKCIASIFTNTQGIDYEVIVVDNASYDGCCEMLDLEFPAIKFIQSEKNLGFASANNLGFSYSLGENLLFLNPDIEVVGTAIDVLLSHLKRLPDAGVIGCKLLNSDGSVQTSCIQPFPTILNQMLDTDYLNLRIPRLNFWGIKPLFFYSGKPEPVEVISGACMMTKRNIFKAVGNFSTDFFMYAEDLDLCYKLRRAGFKAYYVGEASIIHHGGASADRTEVSHFNAVMKRESVAIFFEKHRGKAAAFLYRLSTAFISIIRLCIVALLFPLGLVTQRTKSLSRTFIKWRTVLRWSLGQEKWACRLGCGKTRHVDC